MLQCILSFKGFTFSLLSSLCLHGIRWLKFSNFFISLHNEKIKHNPPIINQNPSAITVLFLGHRIQPIIASSCTAELLPCSVEEQCFFSSSPVTVCSVCYRASKLCSEYQILLLSMGSLRALVSAHSFHQMTDLFREHSHEAGGRALSCCGTRKQERNCQVWTDLGEGGVICLIPPPLPQTSGKVLIIPEVKLIKTVSPWHVCRWDPWCLRCRTGKTNMELAATSEGFILPGSSSVALELWAGRDGI